MKVYSSLDVNDIPQHEGGERLVSYAGSNDYNLYFIVNESLGEARLVGLKRLDESNHKLVDLLIPSSVDGYIVNRIGNHAFQNQKFVRSVSLPESITEIDDGAFKWCSKLAAAVVPEGVTRIGTKAFYGCGNLREISIPNSVTTIGDYAFHGCKNLKTITIPQTLNKIGHSLFGCCSSLKKIVIPDSVIEIGDLAFYSCKSLTSIGIPRSVKIIGQQVFSKCTKLKQLIIPDSVLEMGDCLLNDCESLKALSLSSNALIKGPMVLRNCKKIESIKIPESMTGIVDNAFWGCESLKEISIPQSIVAIGQRAFMYCANLKKINLPNSLVSIGQRAFWDCYGLSEIIVPDSVTQIGDYAFFGCLELRMIKILGSILTISPGTFFGCSKLAEIDFPNSITTIGQSAFEGCSGVKAIKLPDKLVELGDLAFKDCKSLVSVKIPDGVTRIPDELFYNCLQLRECILSESVIEIGDSAFCGCKHLNHLSIPDSVRNIGLRAFCDCSGLNAVVIPQSVTEICEGTFRGCYGLSKVSLPESIINIEDEAFMNCSNIVDFVLPNSLNTIGQKAFWGCSRIKRVVIPSGVVEIGNRAFASCKQLVSIIVDSDNPIYDSRNNCNAIIRSDSGILVQGCNHSVLSKTIKTIGQYAFQDCNRITSIVIPDTVAVIETEAFSNCHNLTEVVISNTVTTIGDSAFAMCDSLETVFMPNSVVNFGKDIFKGCVGLLKIFVTEYSSLNKGILPKDVEIVTVDDFLLAETEKQKKDKTGIVEKEAADTWDETTMEQFLKSNKIELDRLMISGPMVAAEKINIYAFFDSLLFEIKSNVDFNNPEKTLRKVFFEAMNQYAWYPLRFVKYIDVFNLIEAGQVGSLEFYADFIHSISGKHRLADGKELITDTIDKVDLGEGNQLLDGMLSPLEQLFQSNGIFYREFEYCHTFDMPVYSQGLYAIKSDRTSTRNDYIYDELLAELISNDYSWQKNTLRLKQWIDSFNTCYDKFDNGVTNTFYFIGSPWKNMKGYNEISDYVVRAYIGIDKKKGDYEQIRLFLQEFRNFLEQVTFDIIVKLKNQQILQTAKNGSISQAMIRNMSHNWSHVTNNYTSDYSYERFKDDYIKQNLHSYVSLDKETPVFQQDKNLQLPYFIQYQNNRQNYLSEITFEATVAITTKRFFGDVMKELDRERVLLNHIAGISEFSYGFILKYNGVKMDDKNDLSVALPDVLGCQALFNILENIIRNTAKHSAHGSDKVEFTLEFAEIPDHPEYYCLEIDNGIREKDIDQLVYKQNTILNDSVLNDNYKLRDYGLGLLEMTVAAAFLRQIEISRINSYEYHFEADDGLCNKYKRLILLRAFNKNGALGYRLFLQKPKEFLFIGGFDALDSFKDILIKEGSKFMSEDEFATAMSKGISHAHPFLFYSVNISSKIKELLSNNNNCKTLLTARKIELKSRDVQKIMKIIKEPTPDGILAQLKVFAWTKYYKERIVKGLKNSKNASLKIRTAFDPVKGKNPFVSNQVVFLNHANKSTHFKQWKQSTETNSFEAWIENLSSRTSTKLPLFSKYSIGDVDLISDYIENIRQVDSVKYEIFEAYHNKVVVLDERIQRFSLENHEGSSVDKDEPILCADLFKSTNVLIPDTPLDPNTFDEKMIEEIEQFIKKNLVNAFMLIHYGVVERMYKSEVKITNKLNEWAGMATRIVVTSGRGSHSLTLPPTVCFADLSSVLYAFTENRNKFIINNLLNQARRKNGRER
ncbi:MAG: leucine-rich repeat domain-containing protein [Bacteroidales bacterium]|nr:leucine-rich repeat domain-containing protein [Bacteroidales bacterium]